MLRIKPVLSSAICILYFTAPTAQVTPAENSSNSNIVNDHFYDGRHWSIKQVLKDSVLYKYESHFNHSAELTISLLSMIYISFIEEAPVLHLSVSEKLQTYLQKNLLQPYNYFCGPTSCWDPIFFKRYKTPFSNKSFDKYQ